MKITIIGAGNMGGAIARGLAKGSFFKASDITCADQSQVNLDKIKNEYPEMQISTSNRDAIKEADIIVLAVKPWIVQEIAEQLKTVIKYEKQIIVSIAAGVTFENLKQYFIKRNEQEEENPPILFRLMPNTAIEVLNSMTFVSNYNGSKEQAELIVKIFDELGSAMLIEERLMSAGTSLASCGIAFAMRYIRAAMEGGVELGFYPSQAQEIVLQTVKGAAELLLKNKTNPETEIDKVTTPGGITIKGLNEMEHNGFTSAVIKGIKASR